MISIIIPAYNEEKSIKQTIDNIKKVLKDNKLDKGSEIIIVNDGSSDNTLNILKKCDVVVINNPTNMGYGYSIKRGIMAAKNNTIVIIDADLTYPFDMLPQMLKVKNEGYDLVVGARKGKNYRQNILKNILRKILKVFVQFVTNKDIKDINSGFRIFDKSLIIKYMPRLCNTFSFTTSQTLAYLMNNHFVTYVDIDYSKRIGKTKVKLFRDSLICIKYILEAGVYYNPLKIFLLLSSICIIFSLIGFIFSHYFNIHAGYILGIGGLLLSIAVFAIGLIAVILKEIMDKNE